MSRRIGLVGTVFATYFPDAGHVAGAEALLRWNHPELGMVSPVEFIPIAEECGLIVDIGEWVLRTACEQAMRWERAGYPPLTISVNVSRPQLALRPDGHDPAFPDGDRSPLENADLLHLSAASRG